MRTDEILGAAKCDGTEFLAASFEGSDNPYDLLVADKLPHLSYTEYETQVSTNGSCGYFALDTENQKFKVPTLNNVYIKAGNTTPDFIAESLPNIKGTFYGRQNGLVNGSGAFYDGNNPYGGMSSGSYNNQMNFSASRSSSTYQDGAKVQPDSICYYPMVQLYTGVKEKSNLVETIQLNNPYSLFDVKFADHTLDNASWLISNGNWASGTVYTAAYQELLSEYNLGTEQTDGDITYKLTPKGYRIADVAEDTDVSALYTSQGVAWYYVLDTANTQFKLPQSKWGFVGCRNTAGNYVSESLPNIKGAFYGDRVALTVGSNSGAFYAGNNPYGGYGSSPYSINNLMLFDASRSSSTYQDGAPVQQRATEMYLYFYVGETVQDANLINAAKALEQLANKSNVDMDNLSVSGKSKIAALAAPSTRYIKDLFTGLIEGTATKEITIPATGVIFIQFTAKNSDSTLFFEVNDYRVVTRSFSTQMQYDYLSFHVKQGDKLKILGAFASTNVSITWSCFFYAEGEN